MVPRFVIHEHWASRHHFDLRLERDGVLKSWAVPKEIPLLEGERRMAIAVEDHLLSYADFEGEILEGYGKGTVYIWDKGTYEVEKWTDHEILLWFLGQRVRGPYALIHLQGNRVLSQNWLLVKRKEEKL